MQKAQKIPIKRGSITVWIYPTPSGPHEGWTIVYYAPDGKRTRIFRAKRADAEAEAEKIATRLSNLNGAAASISDRKAIEYAQAEELAGRLGKSVLLVVQEHADLTRQLPPGTSWQTVLECYVSRQRGAAVIARNVSDAVDDFISSQRQDGASERHVETLENRLDKFAEHFGCPISTLTGAAIDEWLRKSQKTNGWTGRTRNHYRAAISNLCAFAKRRNYLARDWQEIEFVNKAVEEDGEIEVYTPDQLRAILKAAPGEQLLPFVVIGAFAGVRPSEIQRLTWQDLRFDSGELFVGKGKVRTAGHRVAPLLEAARAWLAPIQKKRGPLTTLKNYTNPWVAILKKAGVPSIHDGLRHSFISYRSATTGSLPQVSRESGTNVSTLTKRYCRPVAKADAEAWFAVLPT